PARRAVPLRSRIERRRRRASLNHRNLEIALSKPLRIATRRSQLALWQAEHVAALLRDAHPGQPVELVPMSTQGDRVQDRALAEVGGKGLFVKELEVAMQE